MTVLAVWEMQKENIDGFFYLYMIYRKLLCRYRLHDRNFIFTLHNKFGLKFKILF